ncbi:hypothetical protein CLV92_11588 [Kineococcus xinjiangensis]|uniref:SIMPL domain-containing protein n=1 Tax=Kineococcus xinjiangensis TaxID=512762 RepID=A0A2S6IDP6_9ACTN|nr:SIMPL domain-containing protein [Kineococcus xinjiangensis]PPK92342.1 hypothetical protein CLV92_11588 [Kineococcus xinjiangensis]
MPGHGPTVTVQGEATVEAEPELAVFAVTLTATGRDRADVLRDVADLHKRTWSALVGLGDGVDVETGGVGVHPRYEDRPGRRPPWFDATAQLSVEVGEFALLPDVLTVLGDVRELSFSGPSWRLRPAGPVQRRARAAAVHDALRRAEEYAAALGCTLTELVDLSDATDGRTWAAEESFPAALSAQAAAHGPLAELDLRPIRQRVSGSVRARFRMTVPDLDALLLELTEAP